MIIEHTYERVADRRIETILATTNDNHLGLVGALGLAPRNIGYHIVHHIHPQVRLEALPRLRDWYLEARPNLYPSSSRELSLPRAQGALEQRRGASAKRES